MRGLRVIGGPLDGKWVATPGKYYEIAVSMEELTYLRDMGEPLPDVIPQTGMTFGRLRYEKLTVVVPFMGGQYVETALVGEWLTPTDTGERLQHRLEADILRASLQREEQMMEKFREHLREQREQARTKPLHIIDPRESKYCREWRRSNWRRGNYWS